VWKWLDRVGMVLLFLSFWFATPEIIGEDRLRRYMQGSLWLAAFVLTTAFGMLLFVADFLALVAAGMSPFIDHYPLVIMIPVTVSMLISFGLQRWVEKAVLPRLLHLLADYSRLRARLLMLGVWMFVAGSALQFMASFFD